MQKLTFRKTINAPREKVWNALWTDETYRQWTAPFGANSRAETDWEKGSKILFLGGEGQNGMVSEVADKRQDEYMSIRHLGMVTDGVEDTESEKVKAWYGAMENYTLKDVDGQTEVLVEMDITDAEADSMAKIWPHALDKLKELSEKQ